jgi:hypothetical protein
MVSWNCVMINYVFFTQVLEFLMNLCILVNEYFILDVKPTKHHVLKCIDSSFTIIIQ